MDKQAAAIATILILLLGLLLFGIATQADAAQLTLEAGAGTTLFPLRGAEIGPFVSIGVGEIPEDIPIIGGETAFVDFGQLDGVATLGPSISIKAITEMPVRIGWAVWHGGRLRNTIYLRYAVPFEVAW